MGVRPGQQVVNDLLDAIPPSPEQRDASAVHEPSACWTYPDKQSHCGRRGRSTGTVPAGPLGPS